MTGNQRTEPNTFFAKVLADQQYQRGRDFERQGYWEQALTCYRRACALDALSPLYLLARGHVCQQHGFTREAEQCYELALKLRPDDVVALYNQAQLYASRGQLDEAKDKLARIITQGTSGLGERAASIFCRLAEIALRREDYATAALHFTKALEASPHHGYATASLRGLSRFAEFRSPFADDGRILPKVALYSYAGTIVLGMPDDNGIDVPPSPALGFESLQEIAQALSRFRDVAQFFAWPFTSVAALDAESHPLAIALGASLGCDATPSADVVPWGSCVLGVSATGVDPVQLHEQVRVLRDRASRTLVYAVGLARPVWEYPVAPQIVTMPVRLEYPWNRGEASAPEHAEAYGAEISVLLLSTKPDGTREAQLRWYEAHPQLSFDVQTLQDRPDSNGPPADAAEAGVATPPHRQ
jgi:tetratricopeptide (TPR) repeat protein